MEKERKITAPDGCKIEKVELIDGVAVVTFREKERKLPKSWEDFYEMTGIKIPYEYTDPGTIAEAVQEAEWETVDKPVKVEGRYLLRGGKENRQCWMCAMYYRPQLCAKYNDLCADDGIFLDTDARVQEAKY